MLKKILNAIISFIFGGVGIFCIIYYFSKYYIDGYLEFRESYIVGFALICAMVIIALILGMILYVKLLFVQKQNSELLDKISDLSKEVEKFYYSEMKSINDNMECILDLDKGE